MAAGVGAVVCVTQVDGNRRLACSRLLATEVARFDESAVPVTEIVFFATWACRLRRMMLGRLKSRVIRSRGWARAV